MAAASLTCLVCEGRLQPPIKLCTNGHAICSSCAVILDVCSECSAEFSPYTNTLLERIIDTVPLSCKRSSDGCDTRLELNALRKHEDEECDFRKVECGIEDCEAMVVVCRYGVHIKEAHDSLIRSITFSREDNLWVKFSNGFGNYATVFKEHKKDLYFMLNFHLDVKNDLFFAFIYFVGRRSQATNYMYTFQFDQGAQYHSLSYSNYCLPFGMSQSESFTDRRCFAMAPSKMFLIDMNDLAKISYSLKIIAV